MKEIRSSNINMKKLTTELENKEELNFYKKISNQMTFETNLLNFVSRGYRGRDKAV